MRTVLREPRRLLSSALAIVLGVAFTCATLILGSSLSRSYADKVAGRVNQALYLDMQLLLSGNNLVKPDRMGMAVGIEARTPFLDWRMMEFAFRSRGATKLSASGDKKHWFKRAAALLIGEDLAYRKKQMFTVPVGVWFKGELHGWLRDTLNSSEPIGELFEPAVVTAMLNQHREGTGNFTRELRALTALALWYREAFA